MSDKGQNKEQSRLRMDHFLSQMIAKVEEHRARVELECSVLSKLLKPWPSNKPSTTEDTPSQEAKECNVSSRKQEGDLSQADLLALEEVNELLTKARWTRESKSKKVEKGRSTLSSQTDVASLADADDDRKRPDEAARAEKPEVRSSSPNDMQSLRQEKTLPKGKKPSKESSAPRRTSVKKVPSSFPQSQAAKNSTSRPSSAVSSRPISRKSDYVPAHVNAPFKTDLNTRMPNRKFNYLKKNQSTKKSGDKLSVASRKEQLSVSKKEQLSVASKKEQSSVVSMKEQSSVVSMKEQLQPLEATAFKTLPGIRTQTKTNDSNNCAANENEPEISSVKPFAQKMSDSGNSGQALECVNSQGISGSGDQFLECVDNPSGSCPGKSQCHQQEMLQQERSVEGTARSLRNHNCDLKIPVKLKKLFSLNNSLLKQCQDTKICKKVSQIDPAQAFVERLKSQTDVSEELWIRERALTCLKAHGLMDEILQSLQLHALTEKSSYEEMYKAKKKLEFVLFLFGKLQDEAEYFSHVQFRPSDEAPWSMGSGVEDSTFACLDNLEELETGTPCTLESRMLQREKMSSKPWTHLRFHEIYLRIQLQLLNLAEEQWWHIVSSDSRDLSIVQLVHGLMTTNGNHLPAIIDKLDS